MLTIQITGMNCGHCERAVRQALEGVPGITRVLEVSQAKGLAEIEGTADPQAVIAAIQAEGYEAQLGNAAG